MLVIDASAIIDVLLERPSVDAIERHMADHDHDLHAPHVFDVEFLNAMRRLVQRGHVDGPRADEAIADLFDLSLERYPHHGFMWRTWALRHNFTAYDASYVALAEALAESGAALLTTDAALARAARKHTGVEVLLAA